MHGVGFVLESRAQGGALRDCEAEQGAVAHAQLRRFDALLQRVCSRARQALEETTTRRGGRVAELGAHFSQGVAQLEVFGAQAVEQRVQRVVLLDVLIDVFFLFRAGRSGFRTARAASSQLCASQRVLDGRERALWRWRRRWREGRKRREAPRGRDALVCQGSDVEAERALLVGLGQARVDACLRGGDGGLCRQGVFGVAISFDEERFPVYIGGAVKFVNVPGAPPEGIVCQMPSTAKSGSQQILMFPLRLSKNDAPEDEVIISTVLYRKQVEDGDSSVDGDEAAADAADAGGDDDGDGHDDGDGDGNGGVASTAAGGEDDSDDDVPKWLIEQTSGRSARVASTAEAAAGGDDDDDDEMRAPSPAPPDASPMPSAPPPPPPPPPVVLAPTPRPQRERKRKAQYGDNGELEGAASSFRSAPARRKASVDSSVEMGIPAFAFPGEQVWAMGLHAGVRKRFKAMVVKLRPQFPRIVVKYTATEDDNTATITLPEMRTAYLTMADVEPKDW